MSNATAPEGPGAQLVWGAEAAGSSLAGQGGTESCCRGVTALHGHSLAQPGCCCCPVPAVPTRSCGTGSGRGVGSPQGCRPVVTGLLAHAWCVVPVPDVSVQVSPPREPSLPGCWQELHSVSSAPCFITKIGFARSLPLPLHSR